MANKIPNPGSPAAIKIGCTCPVLDNARGEGIDNGLFWMNRKCPVHGTKQTKDEVE
jgi:hypothetical protein